MSTIKVNNIQTVAGVDVYTAKAWINFNGTGTIAIRSSGNISSITDNGTGSYKVTFNTAMSSANYSAGQIAQISSFTGTGQHGFTTSIDQTGLLSSYMTIYTSSQPAARYDASICAVQTYE